jgi:ComF family protein
MFIMLKKIYSWLFPATCILCHHPAEHARDLCQACLKELPILPQNCAFCANILTLTEPSPCNASYHNWYVIFSYQTPITKLIMELKFHEKIVNARILGELMASAIQNHWYVEKPLPDVIIPVPLHPKRLRERGFNQALEIARPIAKALKLPLDTHRCQRVKHTAAQAQLQAEKRAQNMRNVFAVRGNFQGQHVAVLDDVTTTGHTFNEFIRVLKAAGAGKIDVWCCAKTLL